MIQPRRRKTSAPIMTPLSIVFLIAYLMTFLTVSNVEASDLRIGMALGYGGTGISTTEAVPAGSTNLVAVQSAQSPGAMSLFLDYQLSDKYLLSFEHSRGFTLGPFSSGVGLTGFGMRYYFSRMPGPTRPEAEETLLKVKRLAFFFGLSAGVASGNIDRPDDAVSSVTGSGIYLGYKLGGDYPLTPQFGFRPEIVYSTTLFSSSITPTSVNMFALQFGLFLFL